ncbi:MAG TPA: aminotransferase class I/II-fold pyridoxal phosphate-dependent enzyme, partial [Pseudomonadales bacterium]|nr:aminotransferase class I/II-fold pyridoxal phosphate-dependent enzyme [Pseudomonadales bacterium]
YAGRPLTALRGLDAERAPGTERVLYLGSFSKVMFPGLRLGYLVVPRSLLADFVAARRALDDHPSLVIQPAVARFMESGAFAAHVRRMRLLYGARQQHLLAAARRDLEGLLTLAPDDAGMHLLARPGPALAANPDDVRLAALAAAAQVSVTPLSEYYLDARPQQGLLMGYAAVDGPAIDAATRRLAGALRGA